MKSANLEMWLCFRLLPKTLKGSDAMNSALTEVRRSGTKQELFLGQTRLLVGSRDSRHASALICECTASLVNQCK